MSAHTPLYNEHVALQAKMVDFHGWMMPLHYGSSIREHQAVRTAAGIFDVSHMTILDISGADSRLFLRKLLTNDVDTLTHAGKALYTCMCNEQGGVIDDLIVYHQAPDQYRLILNSATREADLAWIQEKSTGFAVTLQTRPELSIIAVQGPKAMTQLTSVLSPAEQEAIATLQRFDSRAVHSRFFARTGYTGEDGLEIILPQTEAAPFWKQLITAGFTPCGLAARDSLRLEAGYLLYGQDMDLSTTPLESGLSWVVKWQPTDRHFIGSGALQDQKGRLTRQFVGLTLVDNGIMRAGQRVVIPNQPDGVITSGGFSPTLNQSIALARVPVGTSGTVQVAVRDKLLTATVGPARFYTLSKKD